MNTSQPISPNACLILRRGRIIASSGSMFAILHSLGMFVADIFKSRRRLEAENLFLRHQLNIALRQAPPRLRLRGSDRALLVWMTQLWPSLLGAAQVVQPETILRWHRAGWKSFWRWKSRKRAGRPKIDRGLRDLIQRMSKENPLWGASRIHGELLMLGFEVAQSTVSKYMVRGRTPPSQTWKTFLRNHAEAIAAIDLCVVPTLTFERLFAFLVLGHGRRQLLSFEVTRHPTAEWLARQITEAFPWASAPAYLVQRPCLRSCLQVAGAGDGHPRPTDLAWIAVAKSVCGASDWHRASRVPGPGAGLWGGAPATNSFFLCGLLQRGPHTLGAGQGCASRSGSTTDRGHCSHPNLVWAAPPLRSDMIFGKHNLVVVPCRLGFAGCLDLDEIHVVHHAAVLTHSPFGKEI